MELNSEKYHRIKEILLHLGCTSVVLENLKVQFAQRINSERSLQRVTSLNSLWKLLEKRDVLNAVNEEALQIIIGRVAPNNVAIQNILPGMNNIYHQRNLPHNQSRAPLNDRVLPPVPMDIVERIHQLIEQEIGRTWRELARSLINLAEGSIDQLEDRYKYQGIAYMIHEVLQIHKERSAGNFERWRVDLRHALVQARRTDLSERIDDIFREYQGVFP